MCGRFILDDDAFDFCKTIAPVEKYVQLELELGTIYPSMPALVLCSDHRLEWKLLHFGYFSEYLNKRIINARAETVAEKPMFRSALRYHRCIIPCSSFYEWDSAKQKISFFSRQEPVLFMAGLAIKEDFVILTTEANSSVAPYHHRMPLIFNQQQAIEWIQDSSMTDHLLRHHPLSLSNDLPVQLSLF